MCRAFSTTGKKGILVFYMGFTKCMAFFLQSFTLYGLLTQIPINNNLRYYNTGEPLKGSNRQHNTLSGFGCVDKILIHTHTHKVCTPDILGKSAMPF